MGRVVAGVDAAGGKPVAQLVVVRGDREHHAHLETLTAIPVRLHHRFQGTGADRMHRLAVAVLDVFLHLLPYRIGDGDAVAVQVHAESGDDVRLGAEADGGGQRLTGQHVGAVELAVDHAVEQHLPVGLGLQRHIQPFVLEVTFLVGDRQRRHIGELDKAERQLRLFRPAHQRLVRRLRDTREHGQHEGRQHGQPPCSAGARAGRDRIGVVHGAAPLLSTTAFGVGDAKKKRPPLSVVSAFAQISRILSGGSAPPLVSDLLPPALNFIHSTSMPHRHRRPKAAIAGPGRRRRRRAVRQSGDQARIMARIGAENSWNGAATPRRR